MPKYNWVVGLDPATRFNTGYALYTNGCISICKSGSWEEAQASILDFKLKNLTQNTLVVVEDSNLNPSSFTAFAVYRKGGIKMGLKAAERIGMQKMICAIMVKNIIGMGFDVLCISPSDRRRGIGPIPTKTNRIQFAEITGYKNRTNEHGRDAGILAHVGANDLQLLKNLHNKHLKTIKKLYYVS